MSTLVPAPPGQPTLPPGSALPPRRAPYGQSQPPMWEPPPPPPKSKKRRPWWQWGLLALGILVVLSVMGSLLSNASPTSTTTQPRPTATTVPQPTVVPTPEPTFTPIPAPTATPKPQPTATPKPAPTATLKPPAPANFTLTLTSASIVHGGTGSISVHTQPGAALTIRVYYNATKRVATSDSLQGTQPADDAGNYTWRWKAQTTKAGDARVTITARWNGQSRQITETVPVQ